jgi:hypothetical protein
MWPAEKEEQSLIDRVAAKLPTWKGRLLNKAGHLTLINSILSSVVMYHITIFQLSKLALKKIDKIWRNFLWRDSEDARWENCLVNFQ